MSAYYGISVLRARGGVSDRASARLPGLFKFAETGTVVCASIGSQRRVEVDGGVSAHRRSTPGAHEGVGYGHGQRGRRRLLERRRCLAALQHRPPPRPISLRLYPSSGKVKPYSTYQRTTHINPGKAVSYSRPGQACHDRVSLGSRRSQVTRAPSGRAQLEVLWRG